MASVDWSARPDQIEGLALREVTVDFLFVFYFKLQYLKLLEIRPHS